MSCHAVFIDDVQKIALKLGFFVKKTSFNARPIFQHMAIGICISESLLYTYLVKYRVGNIMKLMRTFCGFIGLSND